MRLLLDDGFPSPPGFCPESVHATAEVVALRRFDASFTGSQTPDWYLHLRAQEAGFDALVARDWHQSEQVEEVWALSRTDLSVVLLPSPRRDRKNLGKATDMIGQLATDLGISDRQVRDQARQVIEEELDARDERDRFALLPL